MPLTSSTDPTCQVLSRAADLIESRGLDNKLVVGPTGPLHPITAIEEAETPECDAYGAMWVLVEHLFRTVWDPRWRTEVSECPGCRICPKHSQEPGACGHGPLYPFNNACDDCVICELHHDAPFMNPAHMANDAEAEDYLMGWMAGGFLSSTTERRPPTTAEVVSALRAAVTS